MTLRLVDYERAVVAAMFRRDPAPHLAAIGGDDRRWRVYRRMVRSRLQDCIDDAFPRLAALLGESWPELVTAFFDEAPPTSAYLRAVPGELAAFVERRFDALPMAGGAPPWTLELARHEWAILDCAVTADELGARRTREETAGSVVALAMDRPAVLAPSHRLLRAAWSVHRLAVPDAGAPLDRTVVEPGRFAVCLYRDPTSHRVRALELPPVAAALIEEIDRVDDRPLVDAVRAAAVREGVAIDADFVQSFADLAADWIERGLWLGSLAET
ncbi:MAG: hypothetical protein NVS3B10_27330 [Polyangiales bacterium]